MISKIEFYNISTEVVDATYTKIFDWDGGETATASDVGILSQESRSVSFKIISDAFIQSLVDDSSLVLYYKIIITNDDDTVEFKGLLEEDGSISINKDNLMADIKVVDLMSQVKEAGKFPNQDNEALSTSQTAYIGILAGLKKRLQITSEYATVFIPTAKYFFDMNLELISLEFIILKNIPYTQMNAPFAIRAKIKRADNSEDYYYTPIYNQPYMYFITDENIEATDQNFIIGEYNTDLGYSISFLHWIDRDSIEDFIIPGHEDNILFQTARVYVKSWHSDVIGRPTTAILGENISYKQTYSSVARGVVTASRLNARFHLDYDKLEDYGDDTLTNYWVYPTESAYPVKRKYALGSSAYIASGVYPTNDNEFLFWCRSRTKDYQQAIFVDWTEETGYIEIIIHYLVKMWGVGINRTLDESLDDKKSTGYSYRKRILRYSGFQLFYDNFSETMIPDAENRAILYNTALSYSYSEGIYNKTDDPSGNYYLGDHLTSVKTLKGLSDSFTELANLPTELRYCKYKIINSGDGAGATGTYSIDGVYSFSDSNGNRYKLTFGGSFDQGASGLGAPEDPYYRNISNLVVTYNGTINLDSYIYSNPFDMYDAVKLSMISNLFAIIENSKNGSIDIVNKVPIETSVALSSNDIIDLEESIVDQDTFDESIYDVLAFENKETLNGIITNFVNNILGFMTKEITFKYSSIFSGITLEIGDNFDYNDTRYSICSVKKENDYIQSVRAIKNGESILQFLIDGELVNAELNDELWKVRSI